MRQHGELCDKHETKPEESFEWLTKKKIHIHDHATQTHKNSHPNHHPIHYQRAASGKVYGVMADVNGTCYNPVAYVLPFTQILATRFGLGQAKP